MSDSDRQLVELITDVESDGGPNQKLSDLVEAYGAALVARVIADGIAAVVHEYEVELWLYDREPRHPLEYLPRDEAVRLARLEPVPAEYRVAHTQTLNPQFDGSLMFRYAADDPAAIAEVRSRAGLE